MCVDKPTWVSKVYRCPFCGGSLILFRFKVTYGEESKLYICPYCGTDLTLFYIKKLNLEINKIIEVFSAIEILHNILNRLMSLSGQNIKLLPQFEKKAEKILEEIDGLPQLVRNLSLIHI